MTQVTRAQEQQLRAVAEQVAAKLETFHAELTAEEQVMLDIALQHVTVRASQTNDVSGHLGPVGVVVVGAVVSYLAGKAVDNFIDSTDWGAVGDFLTRGGSNAFNPQGRQSPL